MTDLVTKTYQELEMLLGHSAASQLVSAYRGQELYIPESTKLNDGHKLVWFFGLIYFYHWNLNCHSLDHP